MQLAELVALLDAQLEPWRFKDFAPNGLQVEGRGEVRKIVAGVTASQALLDAAVACGADAILVHHGYFWKNEPAVVTGIKQRRLKTLLLNDISLLGYHLPLDAHPEFGNNVELGKLFGFSNAQACGEQGLLWHGEWPAQRSAAELAAHVSRQLGREALLLGPAQRPVRRVAWCSGGAQGYFNEAVALGVDAFITGEVSEQNYHLAEELGVAFIAAGHHATERYGVQGLGRWLSAHSDIAIEYIDIPNPV